MQQEQVKQLLIDFLIQNNQIQLAEQVKNSTFKANQTDLEILLNLSKLAGGDQLLQNRVNKPLKNLITFQSNPVLYKRDRFQQVQFKINICGDEKCIQQNLIPVTDLKYLYSQVLGKRYDPHYTKQQTLTPSRIEKLIKNSAIQNAYTKYEHPHQDYASQQSDFARQKIQTTPITEIQLKDFQHFVNEYQELNEQFTTNMLTLFWQLKIMLLKALSFKTIEEVKKYLQVISNFFICNTQDSFAIDVGKLLMCVKHLQQDEFEEFIVHLSKTQIQSVEKLISNTPSFVKNVIGDPHIDEQLVIKQEMNFQQKNDIQDELVNIVNQDVEKAIQDQLNNIDIYFAHSSQQERDELKKMYVKKFDIIRNLQNDQVNQQDDDEYLNVEDVQSDEKMLSSDEEPQYVPSDDEPNDPSNIWQPAPHGDVHNVNKVQETPEILIQQQDYKLQIQQQFEKLTESNYLCLAKQSNKSVQITIPLLPVSAFLDLEKIHFEQLQSQTKSDTYDTVIQKMELLKNQRFLENLYTQCEDASISQIVANVDQDETHEIQILKQQQKSLCGELRVYNDGVRTGGAVLNFVPPQNEDDEVENIFISDEIIIDKYKIIRNCGNATFSSCYHVLDIITNKNYCLKVIKNEKEYFDQALDEVRLLQYLKEMGCEKYNIVAIQDYFYYREHLMIVFPLLGEDLYVHFRNRHEKGLPNDFSLPVIKEIAQQQLVALNFLHQLCLLHLDLKPENILSQIGFIGGLTPIKTTLVDMGSSSFIFDKIHQYIQSRSYRAPEIMLGSCYDSRVDVWSLGGVLAECLTGKVLFPNHSVSTMLCRMCAFLGPFNPQQIMAGRAPHKYLTAGFVPFEDNSLLMPENSLLEHWLFGDDYQNLDVEQVAFSDFLKQMFRTDYLERPTAAMLLQHPFLK